MRTPADAAGPMDLFCISSNTFLHKHDTLTPTLLNIMTIIDADVRVDALCLYGIYCTSVRPRERDPSSVVLLSKDRGGLNCADCFQGSLYEF